MTDSEKIASLDAARSARWISSTGAPAYTGLQRCISQHRSSQSSVGLISNPGVDQSLNDDFSRVLWT
jgi:hypothetical protein